MSIEASLLPEFDHEMGNTRRVMERVPGDCSAWKPHEKSMSMGRLATHLIDLARMLSVIVNDDELDLFPRDGEPFEAREALPAERLLEIFDVEVAAGRARLAGATDEQLLRQWSLKNGGHTIFTLPKVGAYRAAVLNHMLHHRGQLTVYLRLTGTPVPGMYGPSADER
jgi:uncharacterized damage-inducible protein DinB